MRLDLFSRSGDSSGELEKFVVDFDFSSIQFCLEEGLYFVKIKRIPGDGNDNLAGEVSQLINAVVLVSPVKNVQVMSVAPYSILGRI